MIIEHRLAIIPGDKWELAPKDGDPFPDKVCKPVTVLDVKSDWVRYSMGGLFCDERMSAQMFRTIYRPQRPVYEEFVTDEPVPLLPRKRRWLDWLFG